MDVNPLEKSRGITILSKPTTLVYKDHLINIIDTPGHSDFAGEVERVLNIVDNALIVVCSVEGPMAQTKQVTGKAQGHRLKPLLLLNKVDRPGASVEDAELAVMELMDSLQAEVDQDVMQCSAKNNAATVSMQDGLNSDLSIILDQIIEKFDSPRVISEDSFEGRFDQESLQMQVTKTSSNDFFGRLAIGKIFSKNKLSTNDNVQLHSATNATSAPSKITKIWKYFGINQYEIPYANGGDIVCVAGTDAYVNDTISNNKTHELIPYPSIDEPLISVLVRNNTSPVSGKEGSKHSIGEIEKWLLEKSSNDVSLQYDVNESRVKGRGDLHLGILFENMRRDGFEFEISPPEVESKTSEEGELLEPQEILTLEFEDVYVESVIEFLFTRNGELMEQHKLQDRLKMVFSVPTRGLTGFRTDFMSITRGTGIAQREFDGFKPHSGDLQSDDSSALIATHDGVATSQGINGFQDKGDIYIAPGDSVQEGLVIGRCKGREVVVNPAKTQKLTNIRSVGKDDQQKLKGAIKFSIEDALSIVRNDEIIEVTPQNIRLRKKILGKKSRERM